MGQKKVKHKHEVHHKHEEHHKKHEPSRFSLFTHKVSSFFKDIVAAPPQIEEEKIEVPEEKVEEKVESSEKFYEERSEKIEQEAEVEQVEDPIEEELPQNTEHHEALESLNNAVQRWKETGDLGVKLEPPVPLRERMNNFLQRIGKNTVVSVKLKARFEEVLEKVKSRIKKAEKSGEKVNADVLVKQEWSQVLTRLEKLGGNDEREEIEKIYKELESN
ncbi:MAG TPA: hypothetical protein VI612_02755 [Candidatus Nanoarchaeia archaeon]|nr:hypothetical protein [Candidatus Nanoarchaeia archaeon]